MAPIEVRTLDGRQSSKRLRPARHRRQGVPALGGQIQAARPLFLPEDNTPGCTNEGAQFRDFYPQFQKAGCSIAGISRDSVKSHENFKAKMGFPFELLSNEDEKICNQFGVMKMKNLYGKKVRGIERSTFVLDRDRVLRREWRGVKVPGHAQEVLDFVETV